MFSDSIFRNCFTLDCCSRGLMMTKRWWGWTCVRFNLALINFDLYRPKLSWPNLFSLITGCPKGSPDNRWVKSPSQKVFEKYSKILIPESPNCLHLRYIISTWLKAQQTTPKPIFCMPWALINTKRDSWGQVSTTPLLCLVFWPPTIWYMYSLQSLVWLCWTSSISDV